jgi:GDP-4-dehydro-6-deoxy-D-mannose reductase
MRALVTGAGGFIGSHIVDFLLKEGIEVYATVRKKGPKNLEHVKDKISVMTLDITDKEKVEKTVRSVKPDYVFHMAAQAFVIPSWEDVENTFNVNALGTINILDAIKKAKIDPVIIVACSSAEYGLTSKDEIPIKESKEFKPSSPYAISKITTDMISYLYWRVYGMKIIRARIFNTIGPRKAGSAIADFSKMIAEYEKGKIKKIGVGNLDCVLDLNDIRDSVRAFWLLAQKGNYGDVYNVCSGKGYSLRDLLNKLISYSGKKIDVYQDKSKIRPLDDPVFIGDNSKLRKLGWKPEISIDETLKDTLDYWRKTV